MSARPRTRIFPTGVRGISSIPISARSRSSPGARAAARARAHRQAVLAGSPHRPTQSAVLRSEPVQHTVFDYSETVLDDRLDNYFPQGSTQWDAFSHFAHSTRGFFGGRDKAAIRRGSRQRRRVASEGIVGRGVLLDVARHVDIAGDSAFVVTPELLDETAAAQRAELREGDILCVRVGWMAYYRSLNAAARADLAARSRGSFEGSPSRELAPDRQPPVALGSRHRGDRRRQPGGRADRTSAVADRSVPTTWCTSASLRCSGSPSASSSTSSPSPTTAQPTACTSSSSPARRWASQGASAHPPTTSQSNSGCRASHATRDHG